MASTQEIITRTPIGWGSDKFTGFMDTCRRNQLSAYHISSAEFSDFVEIIDILSVFSDKAIPHKNLESWLLIRASFSLTSAASVAATGDYSSAYTLSRVALERAAYSYYISSDPKLEKLWINQRKSRNNRDKFDKKFRMRAILHFLSKNEKIPSNIKKLYENANNLGAHAAEAEFLANSPYSREDKKILLIHLHKPIGNSFNDIAVHLIRCGLILSCIGSETLRSPLPDDVINRTKALTKKYIF